MSVEKGLLPAHALPVHNRKSVSPYKLALAAVTVTACTVFAVYDSWDATNDSVFTCPQVPVLAPQQNVALWEDLGDLIESEAFKNRSIEWLSGAVQVQTPSFDNMEPVGKDKRWDVFGPFHDYLAKEYPSVHKTLKKTTVNSWGLVYEWTGSDSSLKPILLAAHQDVVPVHPDTVGDWTHPPWSGYYDGTRIWGRGSSDDKGGLIGIMSSLEVLIEHGFKPRRTIVAAFGFDEESNGIHGAGTLGPALLETYGQDAFAFIVDEGAPGGFSTQHGTVFASPGVAEKGYFNSRLDVASPGGHSSVPPSHTSIGILAALLARYEEEPYDAHITRNTIAFQGLQCFAAHGKTLPSKLRAAIEGAAHSDLAMYALEKIMFQDNAFKSLVSTTQAVDLIGGGVKTNALPENAWAVVNHRISTKGSVAETMAWNIDRVKDLAQTYNLSFSAYGKEITNPKEAHFGSLVLSSAFAAPLEPAPLTPISGEMSTPYKVLSGTIKATYNAHHKVDGPNNIIVSPGMPTGNTDTRYYWQLSAHIFRYNHKNSGSVTNRLANGVHTVNENIDVDAYMEMIRFFETLILNADEAVTL